MPKKSPPFPLKQLYPDISIPAKYKWICQQRDGEIMISVDKPVIVESGDYFNDDENQPIEFWEADKRIDILIEECFECSNWKKSLRLL